MDYSSILNPIARDIKPSGIREFFGIAATRKDCISLGVGEPDFSTPTAFSQAGINSINAGKTQAKRSIPQMQVFFNLEKLYQNTQRVSWALITIRTTR